MEGRVRKRISLLVLACFVAGVLTVSAAAPQGTEERMKRVQSRLGEQVRKELVTLPWYGVFDNLTYQIQGAGTVVLGGQVTRPTLKSSAENVVKQLEGVEKVVNNIEVLPVSPNDDNLRIAVYRAIYGRTGLDRYALRAVPPIHIIVKNGDVTLVGVVANEGDKNLAGMAARQVPGAFSITNNLMVEKEN